MTSYNLIKLEFLANCNEQNKCEENEGDCYKDSDCLHGLRCGLNSENCNITFGPGIPTSAGCCYQRKY